MQGKLRSSIAGPDVRRKRPFDTQTSSDEDEFSDLETDSECSDEDHAKQQKAIAKEAAHTIADDLESKGLDSLSGTERITNVKCDFTLCKS